MKKNFILDTNVLLHDPRALFTFADNNIVVPIYVIEEIDQFKKDLSELGRNARLVARYIDQYRMKGKLSQGVELPGGGTLRVVFTERQLPPHLQNHNVPDNRILAVALDVMEREPEQPAIFVTKDANLRIRADALGLPTVNYDTERVDIDELYSGMAEIEVSAEALDTFYHGGVLEAEGEFSSNQYLLLREEGTPSNSALARVDASGERIIPIIQLREGIWGIRPRNKEQTFAIDLLLDDEVKLVTMVGKAGTGKTLLALAAGLYKVTDEQIYGRLLVSRPIFPLGRDLGYLPGDVEEKLNPWMQPIYDNIEYLLSFAQAGKVKGRGYQGLIEKGVIEIEPLTYIRGRSIPDQYMIIDEAQNLTPHEVKTIVTRVGEGTKIIFTGDPYQIDHPYVDSTNNGLVHLVNKFRAEPLAGSITLVKGERSDLAELAANLL